MVKRAHPEFALDGTRAQVEQEIEAAAQRAGWVPRKPTQRRRREWRLTFTPEASRSRMKGKLWVHLATTSERDQTAVSIEARAPTRALVKRALREVVDELEQPTVEPRPPAPTPRLGERLTTRIVVPGAVAVAVLAAMRVRTPLRCTEQNAVLHGPRCGTGKVAVPDLPSFAFGQPTIYHVEAAVIVFFVALLVLTPTIIAIFRGELPLEISTEGVKFREDLTKTDEELKQKLASMELQLGKAVRDVARLAGLHEGPAHTHTGPSS